MATKRSNVWETDELYSGTTIIVSKDRVGTYITSDGFANAAISDEQKRENKRLGIRPPPKSRNSRKTVKIGNNIYAALSGNSGWFVPIIQQLWHRVQSENLTTLQCAQHAESVYNDTTHKPPRNLRRIKGFNIQNEGCGITFASFNVDNPTVVFVGRSRSGDVTIKEFEQDEVAFNCHGSGGRFAKEILDKKFKSGLDEEKHGIIHLKAMRRACKKDPNSGGLTRVMLLTSTGVKELHREEDTNLRNVLAAYKHRQRQKRRQVAGWIETCKRIKRHKFHLEVQKFGGESLLE